MVPTPYNLTLMGNSTSLLTLTQTVNTTLMHGWFGRLALISIFIIILIIGYKVTRRMSTASIGASAIVFILAIFFRIMSLATDMDMWMALGLFIFCAAVTPFLD